MEKQRAKYISEHVKVFGFKKLQDALTLIDYMQKAGVTIQELLEYKKNAIQYQREQVARKTILNKEWEQKAPKCPECRMPLLLRRIGFPPGRGNSNGYKSEWYCNYGDCSYEKFSTATVEEELNKYGLKNIGSRFVRRCNQEK